jgi:hypothetical protein
LWQGSAQSPNLVLQHQVVLEQAQGGSLAHGPPYQPFPPPAPRASPEQLLSEIRQALPGYELSRLVAIEATQRVLSKHLSEMVAFEENMGGLFAERANMPNKCHTEHLRLIHLLMTSSISVPVPTPVVSTVPPIASQSPEVSERTTYKQLRRQLAFAPPSKQNDLLYEHLRRAAEALQRPNSVQLLEAIMSLDNSKILGMTFSTKNLTTGYGKERPMNCSRRKIRPLHAKYSDPMATTLHQLDRSWGMTRSCHSSVN